MPEATNQQMQNFSDQRLRRRSESFRDIRESCLDDVAVIDDVYARAVGNNRWTDARIDGPPHLLQSGNSASPDDMLNYNAFIHLFEKFMNGNFSDLSEANSAAALWAILQDACVRPIQG